MDQPDPRRYRSLSRADAGPSPVELWDYNRQTGAEADRVRDFLVLHYATAGGQSRAALVPRFGHTLEQFRERGRLPFYEEETFSRQTVGLRCCSDNR